MPEREHDLLVLGQRAKAEVTNNFIPPRRPFPFTRPRRHPAAPGQRGSPIRNRQTSAAFQFHHSAAPRRILDILFVARISRKRPAVRRARFTAHKRQMAQHARNDPERNALMRSIDQETARPLRQQRSQPPAPIPITSTPTLSTPSLPAVANDDNFFDPLAEEMPCRPTARIF